MDQLCEDLTRDPLVEHVLEKVRGDNVIVEARRHYFPAMAIINVIDICTGPLWAIRSRKCLPRQETFDARLGRV
jgi:hypothetical protein